MSAAETQQDPGQARFARFWPVECATRCTLGSGLLEAVCWEVHSGLLRSLEAGMLALCSRGRTGVCYQAGMLIEQIRTRAKEAMKAKDVVAREVLRVALGEVQTEEARREGSLDDAAVEKILRKLIKSNTETLEATEDSERRATLEQENGVLDSLLPKTLSEDEIVAALAPIADEIKAAKADGPATGMAMKHLKSQDAAVDGKTVATAVKRLRGSVP